MTPSFEIVAHRGVPTELPENTIPSFRRAVELGADAIELDVRLTQDQIPIVYHYFYLNEGTTAAGPVFNFTFAEIQNLEIKDSAGNPEQNCRIPTLHEVLETFGGRIGFEIEIKGPEPESSRVVGAVLCNFEHLWDTIEITSYEPMLLADVQQRCPGLATDLLFPRSEDWMGLDVVAYAAVHRARLAGARAVHLHPTQLTHEVVAAVRSFGLEVHAWEVDDRESLRQMMELDIPRICTNKLHEAVAFRR